ncbi:MAG: type II toxin-antitoxin system death-on-curing family toxin [Pleurocapsa sp.]
MNNKIIYIDLQQAIELHSWIIERTDGVNKIQDYSHLENILLQVKSEDITEFNDKLTQLVFAINESHKLIEDSKRLSIALGCYFLELNGYDYVVHYFATEMENIVVWLANKRIDRDLLAEIIESLIDEEDYSEELKLKIAIAF